MTTLQRFPLILILMLTMTMTASAQWLSGPALPTGGSAREGGVAINKYGVIYLFGGSPFSGATAAVTYLNSSQTSWITSTPLEGEFLYQGAAIDSLNRFILWYGIDSGGGEGDSYEWTAADGDAGGIDQPNSSAFQLFAQARDDAGLVYTIGGSTSSIQGATTPVSGAVERYNGATDSWSSRATMTTPVSDAAACNDGAGHILVLGGVTASGARTANVAQYDVATNTWSDIAVADMPVALSGLRAVRGADGRIYAIGGSDGTIQNTVYVLDLMTNTWSNGPNLITARQRFGCALDSAGYIWVCGGSTTNSCEMLFTPTLPSIVTQPENTTAWLGSSTGFGLRATGTDPFSYVWRKDGNALSDGPTGTGSTIVGSQTASFGILGLGYADVGSYDCIVSNAAGSTTSSAAIFTMQIPRALPESFTFTDLHPAGALSSEAHGVDGGIIGGSSSYSNATWGTLTNAVMWTGTAASAQTITPSNSVGGNIAAVKNGTLVGWWWWPYTTTAGTGYYRHAAVWTNSGANFYDVQASGQEIGALSDTDGVHHVGSMVYDETSTNGNGFYWPQTTSSYAQSLTAPGNWGSNGVAIDGPNEYGSVHIGYGVVHAARWTGGNSAWIDMNPTGATRSYVYGAGDGQQVGQAFWGNAGQSGVFGGSAGSFYSFDPSGTMSVSLADCEGGFQVGAASINGTTSAAIWAGAPGTMLNLHQYLPAQYSVSIASAVDIDANGLVTVVGKAYDATAGVYRAVMWQGQSASLWQDADQVSAAAGGVFHMFVDAGPSHAGQVYAIVGSASGTNPGVMIGNNQLLPLNPDFYLDQTILYPNTWIVPSFSYLDGTGRQIATATLPAGALYVVYPVTIHHALVVISPGGTGFDLISGPVSLTITP